MTTLYIDSNEPTEVQTKVIEEIAGRSDIDINVETEGLKTGDFLMGDVVIERKEASDLASSITDGRLREQTKRMSEDFQHRYLLVEGNPYNLKYSNIHPNSVAGSLLSTNCKRDVDIIPVGDQDSLAYAVYKICKLHEDGVLGSEQKYLKTTSVEEEDVRVSMLAQIEGISVKKAREIFQETDFVSIAHIIDYYNVDGYSAEAELKKVDGIGPTLSQRVIDAFK